MLGFWRNWTRNSRTLRECKNRVKNLELELNKLKEQFIPPEPPQVKDIISAQAIKDIYAEIFPNDTDRMFFSDSQYEITSISEIRRFINWDNTDQFSGKIYTHDCDDFALALAGSFAKYPDWSGFPVTYVWAYREDLGGGHAFATCVAWSSLKDRIPRAYFLEPANDNEIAYELVEGIKMWLLPF